MSIIPNVDNNGAQTKLFHRERTIHETLGGGKVVIFGIVIEKHKLSYSVADVLLWRDKVVSGAFFMGVMSIWFLFVVAEYNLVTFLCHSTITVMLVIFIWSNGAKASLWTPPAIPNILLEESMLYVDFCKKLDFFISRLLYIACGNDIIHFGLVILGILILSTIGNYIATLNHLFIVVRRSHRQGSFGRLYYACPDSKPLENDYGCGYFAWKDSSSRNTTPSDSSSCASSSSGSSRATLSPKNKKCSNCKLLKLKIKAMEARQAMENNPDDHPCESAAILHELLNEMDNLRV